MDDKLMCISNDDTQIYPFCILQLVAETFQPSNLMNQPNLILIKVPKVVKPTNKKTVNKDFGD